MVDQFEEAFTLCRDREERARFIDLLLAARDPVYLLIDREEAEVTVYCEPSGDDYAQAPKYKLGRTVSLPAPLGFELDTAEF